MPVVFVHEGAAIDYTPEDDVAAGTVVVQGDLVGVTRLDIKAGKLGALAVAGVFNFPKTEGVSIPAGTTLYWDEGAQQVTESDVDNKLIGKSVKLAVDADLQVPIRMSQ